MARTQWAANFVIQQEEASVRGINGKVVIVTGGAGGIGSAICRRVGAEGATVAVFDINREAAAAVAADIQAKGGKARAFAVDLTSQDSVITAVTAVESEVGPVDVLVNNAGWDKVGNFLDTDKPLWDKIVAINLYGALYMHHAVVKGMAARGAGRVINIASDAGRVGSVDPGFGTALLARVVGEKKAREIWYLCRRYAA